MKNYKYKVVIAKVLKDGRLSENNRFSVFAKDDFCRRYKKGSVVTGTKVGLMCFHKKSQAKYLIWHSNKDVMNHHNGIYFGDYEPVIIRVKPLSKPVRIPFWNQLVSRKAMKQFENAFFRFKSAKTRKEREVEKHTSLYSRLYRRNTPYEGTVCYEKIKVID